MTLAQIILRTVAAEENYERKVRIAARLLMERETDEWKQVHSELVQIMWAQSIPSATREAAGIALQALTIGLFCRVDALDEGFEGLLDEVSELEFGSDGEPIYTSPDGSFLVPLSADSDTADDVFLDVWPEGSQIRISMRTVDGAESITGVLDKEEFDFLRRCMFLASQDASAAGV